MCEIDKKNHYNNNYLLVKTVYIMAVRTTSILRRMYAIPLQHTAAIIIQPACECVRDDVAYFYQVKSYKNIRNPLRSHY